MAVDILKSLNEVDLSPCMSIFFEVILEGFTLLVNGLCPSILLAAKWH